MTQNTKSTSTKVELGDFIEVETTNGWKFEGMVVAASRHEVWGATEWNMRDRIQGRLTSPRRYARIDSTMEVAMSKEYENAIAEAKAAQAEYEVARDAYRAREIGDDEYLVARQAWVAAGAKFDAAYAKAETETEGSLDDGHHEDRQPLLPFRP